MIAGTRGVSSAANAVRPSFALSLAQTTQKTLPKKDWSETESETDADLRRCIADFAFAQFEIVPDAEPRAVSLSEAENKRTKKLL